MKSVLKLAALFVALSMLSGAGLAADLPNVVAKRRIVEQPVDPDPTCALGNCLRRSAPARARPMPPHRPVCPDPSCWINGTCFVACTDR